jgi:carbon monoxide dehydrogenase subunit G
MPITFRRDLTIRRPVDDVWRFLTDPDAIAGCVPGAHLLDIVDGTFTGTVDLSFGPIGTTLAGEAGFREIDAAAHQVLLVAEAREQQRDGGAELRMRSRLSEIEPAATRVDVDLGIRLSGRLAGPILRNVLGGAAEILFRRFFACVRQRLEET